MGTRSKQLTAWAAAVVVAAGLAGCGDGGGDATTGPGERIEATKGGTLQSLQFSPSESLDPQRMYSGRDLANMNRTVYRGWVGFPASTDPVEGNTPVPDLATDTGTPNEDATTWSFTVREGVRWQDGSDITCEDFRYGLSRTFATDIITGGPSYILEYLDIPRDEATGQSEYAGPYQGDGQDLFDRAVTCEGQTITYRFNKPWPDFPLAAAALRAFDPYKASEDQGEQSNLTIFSNGPYLLEDEWDLNTGGTLVQNPEWDPETDELRQANPDQIVFSIGVEQEVINERLIADAGDDQCAVTAGSISPPQYSQIEGPVADRSINIESPFVQYLVPNFNRVTNPQVREALAVATDRAGYSAAIGGDNASVPAQSIVSPTMPDYVENPTFPDPAGGDTEAAAALLEQSGEDLPYPLKYTYPGGTPTADKAAAALKASWDEAGFDVQLDPLTNTYGDVISNPDADSDVFYGGWASDWPSVSTVIPPLFDSRINFTQGSNGKDYGNYQSDEVNRLIDEALAQTELDAQAEIFRQIDVVLGEDTAYIPLDVTRFYFLRGSKVENYVNSVSTSGYPDLAVVSLAEGC